MGPFQHVIFIYFYLSTGAQNRTCTAGWVSWLLHMEVDPSFLFDRSPLGLGSPWVSSGFVDEMVWKRSRLLNCTLSQHKQRAFPPGPRNGPQQTPIHPPLWLHAALPLACFAAACAAKTNRGRSGLRHVGTGAFAVPVHYLGLGLCGCQPVRWSNRPETGDVEHRWCSIWVSYSTKRLKYLLPLQPVIKQMEQMGRKATFYRYFYTSV